MLAQDVFDTITAEGPPTGIREYRVIRLAVPFSEPVSQITYNFFAQGDTSSFAPFPGAAHMSAGFQDYVPTA
jgi:hypothetical protein